MAQLYALGLRNCIRSDSSHKPPKPHFPVLLTETMSQTYKFSIGHRQEKTTAVSTASELDRCLKDLLSTIPQKSGTKRVVGLHIVKSFEDVGNKVSERVALLTLYHGTTSLIIQLHLMSSAPCSLSAFLQLPEISFVGVGIRHSLEALDRDYGVKCRNAVDLGELAATVRENGMLRSYGLLDLVDKLCGLDVQGMRNSFGHEALRSWDAQMLTLAQVQVATWSCFLCFYLGNQLFGGF